MESKWCFFCSMLIWATTKAMVIWLWKWNYTTPSCVEIVGGRYEDPYEPISRMKCHIGCWTLLSITQEVAMVHLGACAVGHCSWKAAAIRWYYEAKWRRCQVSGGRTVLGWLLGNIYNIHLYIQKCIHPNMVLIQVLRLFFLFSCSMFDHPTYGDGQFL